MDHGDYFPEMLALKRPSGASSRDLLDKLPAATSSPVPVPKTARTSSSRRSGQGPSCSLTKRSCGRCGSGRASRRSLAARLGEAAALGRRPPRAGPGSGATDISAQCAGSTSGCDWSSPSSIEEPERGLSRLLPLATSAGGGQRPRTHARRDGRFAARGRARPADQARRRWDLVSARGAAEPGGSFARTAIDELAEETGVEVSERNSSRSAVSPRPRRTRSTTPTAMSPTASPCSSWRGPGRATFAPTRRSRPRPSSSTWVPFPTRSTLPPPTLLSCLRPTSAPALSRCADVEANVRAADRTNC